MINLSFREAKKLSRKNDKPVKWQICAEGARKIGLLKTTFHVLKGKTTRNGNFQNTQFCKTKLEKVEPLK